MIEYIIINRIHNILVLCVRRYRIERCGSLSANVLDFQVVNTVKITYVTTHIHIHIHTYTRTHAHTQIHMYTDMRTRMRTRTRSQSHAHTGVTHNYRHTLGTTNISTNRLHLGCFFIVDKLVTHITVCGAHGAGGIGRKKSPLILNRHKSDAANLRRQTRRYCD